MKPQIDETIPVTEIPWVSQRWAATYLGVDISTIWRRMIPFDEAAGHVTGKIRFRRMKDWNNRMQPRLLREDIYVILPPPEQ